MLTATEARKLYEGEEIDYQPPKVLEHVLFILDCIERMARQGHTEYWCLWIWKEKEIWMVDEIKDQLESLGYIIEDLHNGHFIVYW